MQFKRHVIVKLDSLAVWFLWTAIAGAVAGFMLSHYTIERVHVPLEALKQAREVVEADMRAACSSWFTDKRGVADKRIVVCRSPKFLDAPNEQR